MEAVAEQGKGHVVRAAFSLLGDWDAVLLVDGDGTYPAEAAPLLIAPVLDGTVDMVVGARQPELGAGAMSPVRGLGNLLIRYGLPPLDRQGNRRSALGLSGLLAAVPPHRVVTIGRLRDRDRAGHRGREP